MSSRSSPAPGDPPCPDCLRWVAALGTGFGDYVRGQAAGSHRTEAQVRADLLAAYHRTHADEWIAE